MLDLVRAGQVGRRGEDLPRPGPEAETVRKIMYYGGDLVVAVLMLMVCSHRPGRGSR